MRINLLFNSNCFYFLALIFLWSLDSPPPSIAFEGMGYLKKECQTTCHQPEHILKAKKNKFIQAECKSCHIGHGVGHGDKKISSPFPATNLIENTGKNNILLQSIIQVGFGSVKKNKPSWQKEVSPINLMSIIPAGEFVMGSNERWDDEAPEHIATTSEFYIDIYEVTNKDYKVFTDATERAHPYHWPEGNIPKEKENHPVVYVSWFDARDYCAWAGKRLPNEQEWEKAARGEDGLIYPWGNEWSLNKSNNPYKNSKGTEPIGSYPEGRSPYGLYDLSGNVWEWVDSYYLPHPGNPVTRAEYGKDKRVLKGGSWFDCLSYGCGLSAPTFNRSFFTPEVKNNSFGFRCAKSKKP